MSGLAIRPLEATDRAAWDRLWAGYHAFYEADVSAEMYGIAFARLLSGDAHEYHGLLAVHNGQPVGLAHYLFHRHGWRVENVTYLQDLFVAPEARGTGAGRALIEGVYAAADAAQAPHVYWTTQDFNTTARQLYDRIGVKTPFIRYQRPNT